MLAQHMLVAPARRTQPPFVFAKRVGQKPRLPPHPYGRAVVVARTERIAQKFLEPLHLLRLAAEMVVEPEDFRDESGSKLERQLFAGRCRGAGGRLGPLSCRSLRPIWKESSPSLIPVPNECSGTLLRKWSDVRLCRFSI